MRELVAISVRSRHLNVNSVTSGRAGGREVCCHRDSFTVQHRDGDAIGDVEAGSADAVGINSPFADRGRFPAHTIEQQLRRDVLNIAGCYVDLKPR